MPGTVPKNRVPYKGPFLVQNNVILKTKNISKVVEIRYVKAETPINALWRVV
jgi:hypothetical protein